MFGLGFTEIMVILVVALLVFGPTKLPELARSLGKGLAEFRRASTDIRNAVMEPPSAPTPPPPVQGPADQVAAAATPVEKPPANETPAQGELPIETPADGAARKSEADPA